MGASQDGGGPSGPKGVFRDSGLFYRDGFEKTQIAPF